MPGGSLAELVAQFGAPAPPADAAGYRPARGGERGAAAGEGGLDRLVARRLAHDVLSGLSYLHAQRVVHRDVKGENVLVDADGVAKLADFGASKRLALGGTLDQSHLTLKGTPYFMAPEQMAQSHETKHGRKADVWAVGGVVLLMATGEPPWKGLRAFGNPFALFMHVLSHETLTPPLDGYAQLERDRPLRELVERAFTRDPEARPSAAELLRDPAIANARAAAPPRS